MRKILRFLSNDLSNQIQKLNFSMVKITCLNKIVFSFTIIISFFKIISIPA